MGKIVIIPAYQPDEKLVRLIERLAADGVQDILLVNDGSSATCAPVFTKACALKQVELIVHQENRGKGAALRSAFSAVLEKAGRYRTVITADADGQHTPEDIRKVAAAADDFPDGLILGARQFKGYIPLRSRIGNDMTRLLFNALFGTRLGDTQTGLRAIPVSFLSSLMKLEGDRYNFELEMLVCLLKKGVEVREVPVQTVYEKKNASSHFRPFADSFNIYKTMFYQWLKK